jgi:hypothetical protein
MALKFAIDNWFDVEEPRFFLQGFGLVVGKIPEETFSVKMYSETGLFRDVGIITVEKKGPIDVVLVQDVFLKKIQIFHSKLNVKLFFKEPLYRRPYIQCNGDEEESCMAYLIFSRMN